MSPKLKAYTPRILLALYFFAFILVFIRNAFITEDAFITFRAVDNFLKGYGPVWNVGERVQVYTHPLWYALLVIGVGIFKHHYWFTLALCFVCTLGTLWIFWKIMRRGSSMTGVVATLVLLFSPAFAVWSSSGLENPLHHLLLAAYVFISITQQDAGKRFLYTGLLYSLLFLTRPDAIVLVTPAQIWWLWQAYKTSGWKHTIKLAVIAAAPALAWEAFSLIYYGSLVPNTAIAKTSLGYPRSELFKQAWGYFNTRARRDSVTMLAIVMAFAVVCISWRSSKNILPKLLMGGVALQLFYILYVGGDYMGGRFLSAPLFASMCALALTGLYGGGVFVARHYCHAAVGAFAFEYNDNENFWSL